MRAPLALLPGLLLLLLAFGLAASQPQPPRLVTPLATPTSAHDVLSQEQVEDLLSWTDDLFAGNLADYSVRGMGFTYWACPGLDLPFLTPSNSSSPETSPGFWTDCSPTQTCTPCWPRATANPFRLLAALAAPIPAGAWLAPVQEAAVELGQRPAFAGAAGAGSSGGTAAIWAPVLRDAARRLPAIPRDVLRGFVWHAFGHWAALTDMCASPSGATSIYCADSPAMKMARDARLGCSPVGDDCSRLAARIGRSTRLSEWLPIDLTLGGRPLADGLACAPGPRRLLGEYLRLDRPALEPWLRVVLLAMTDPLCRAPRHPYANVAGASLAVILLVVVPVWIGSTIARRLPRLPMLR
ncbi:hypothetical protein H696_01605 [Fonticula alba]|uniref:Uncharacterized protein n=1 Tax=Fonticula alba TaxID=691883 RepID=A0A058ZE30_FONAL|nr:hypothetical protein H696_01605 [Fonticula alba]KCV72206.1 hypothetical protein H696_01605 [Fonticula alba]|eukprot:XP_009493784.1 hypothetical protein H696_01605 [Fonticula alba]